jgi:hypothetical protein
MTNGRIALCIALALPSCSLVGGNEQPVLIGEWGGVEAELTATRNTVTLKTKCDISIFPGPATVSAEGKFSLETKAQNSMWGNVGIKLHGIQMGDTVKATFEFDDVYHPGQWNSFDVVMIANKPGQFSHYDRLCPL